MKTKNTLVTAIILFLLFTSCTDKATKKEIKTHQSAASVQNYILCLYTATRMYLIYSAKSSRIVSPVCVYGLPFRP